MKTPYTDEQIHKIARAVTWMIEKEYWKDHFIWERDAAITDICLKYFTFNDCPTVCYIIRCYLRKLLENRRYNGLNFTRRQDQIRNGLLLTIPVSELEHNIDLTPRNAMGVSFHPDKPKPVSTSFATKFKEHFGFKNTRDDWNLYQREKRYFETFGIPSWEDSKYPRQRKKPGRKSKKKDTDG